MSKHKFLFKHSVLYNNSKSLFSVSTDSFQSNSTDTSKNNAGRQETSLSSTSSIPTESVLSTRNNYNVGHEFPNNTLVSEDTSNFRSHTSSTLTSSSSNIWNSTDYPCTRTVTTTNEDDFENSRGKSLTSTEPILLSSSISRTSVSTRSIEEFEEIPAALKPTNPYDLSVNTNSSSNSFSCPESYLPPFTSSVLTNLSSHHHHHIDERVINNSQTGSNIQNPNYTYYYHDDHHNYRNSYNHFNYKYYNSNTTNYDHNTHQNYSTTTTANTTTTTTTNLSSHQTSNIQSSSSSIQHSHPHEQRILQYYDNTKNHPGSSNQNPGGDYYYNNGGEEVTTRQQPSSSRFVLRNEETTTTSGEHTSLYKSTTKINHDTFSNKSEFHPVIVSHPISSTYSSSDGLTILASAASTQPMNTCSIDQIHDQRQDHERPVLSFAISHSQSEEKSNMKSNTPCNNNTNTNTISVIKSNTISVITRVPTIASNRNYSSPSTTSNNNDKNHAESTLVVNKNIKDQEKRHSRETSVEEHQETVGKISPDNKNILIYHEGKQSSYECRVCAKKFKSKNNFKYHMHDSNWKFPFKCGVCDKGLIASTHYKLHMKTHEGERKYQCDSCPKMFYTQQKLSRHIMSIHSKQKKCVCSFESCTRSFHTPMELQNHLLLVHNGQLGYSCLICQKKFISESQLKAHEFNHKERPMKTFSCDICELKFTRLNHLENHMLIHQGIKAFKCEKCTGRSFRTKLSLAHHMKAHNDERPFVCQYNNCHSAFVLKKDLVRHENIHTDKADFHCVECNKHFRRKDNLIRHVKMHHCNEETERE